MNHIPKRDLAQEGKRTAAAIRKGFVWLAVVTSAVAIYKDPSVYVIIGSIVGVLFVRWALWPEAPKD